MQQKDIVMIVPAMVPCLNSWGECQRMYYLAEMLEEQGMKVLTISPKRKENAGYQDKPVHFESVFLEGYANTVGTGSSAAEQKQPQQQKPNSLVKTGKKMVHAVLEPIDRFIYNEPSRYEGYRFGKWVRANRQMILRKLQESHTGTVLISGPSFALFSLAEDIRKAYPDMKIILDYRDPWHLWNGRKNPAYLREKKLLGYADKMICFSEAFREDMCKVFGIDEKKTEVIYNGFSATEWKRAEAQQAEENRQPDEKLILTYTGTISFADEKNNYRNPNPLIRAVQRIGDDRVELRFIGVRPEDKNRTQAGVVCMENVPQGQAFRYMKESDVLINIHDIDNASGRYIISGKFYDYVRSGRVIWNIGNEHSLVWDLMKEYQLGFSCVNQEEQLEQVLLQLIEAWEKGKLKPAGKREAEAISSFSREFQNKKYADILRGL